MSNISYFEYSAVLPKGVWLYRQKAQTPVMQSDTQSTISYAVREVLNYNTWLLVNLNGEELWIKESDLQGVSRVLVNNYGKSSINNIDFEGEFGKAVNISIKPSSNGVRHDIKYSLLNDFSASFVLGNQLNHSFTPPLQWCKALVNTSSSLLDIELLTVRSDNNLIIARDFRQIPISMASSIRPSIENLSLKFISNSVPSDWGVALQGQSAVSLSFTPVLAYNSPIAKTYVSIGNQVYNSNNITSLPLNLSGRQVITVKICDMRARCAQINTHIDVLPYNRPSLNNMELYRCNANGEKMQNGTCARFKANINISQLPNMLVQSISIKIKNDFDSNIISINDFNGDIILGNNFNVNQNYFVDIKLSDGINTSSYYLTLQSQKYALHIKKGGNAVAFGCSAVENNSLDIASSWSLGKNMLNKIHPVGSIYLSLNNINPSESLGGVWRKITGKFLLASSSQYPLNSIGGQSEHSLSLAELPTHSHNMEYSVDNGVNYSVGALGQAKEGATTNITTRPNYMGMRSNLTSFTEYKARISSEGNGQPHSNMPPYISVNVWERIE